MLEMINYEEKLKQHVEEARLDERMKIETDKGRAMINNLKQKNPNADFNNLIAYTKDMIDLSDETVSLLRNEFIKN
jgi:hypothetical protein